MWIRWIRIRIRQDCFCDQCAADRYPADAIRIRLYPFNADLGSGSVSYLSLHKLESLENFFIVIHSKARLHFVSSFSSA
jgi:hypothetical protein